MNMEGRSPPSRRESLNDEAILDHLSETALAETELAAPMAQPPDEDPLSAEMFLDIAAGFLSRRVDRAELIERLRSRVLPAKCDASAGAPAASELPIQQGPDASAGAPAASELPTQQGPNAAPPAPPSSAEPDQKP
jgi:hypothetical protein